MQCHLWTSWFKQTCIHVKGDMQVWTHVKCEMPKVKYPPHYSSKCEHLWNAKVKCGPQCLSNCEHMWNAKVKYGNPWGHRYLELSGAICNYIVLSGAIWCYLELSGAIWIIWRHLGATWSYLWGYLGLPWDTKACLGLPAATWLPGSIRGYLGLPLITRLKQSRIIWGSLRNSRHPDPLRMWQWGSYVFSKLFWRHFPEVQNETCS